MVIELDISSIELSRKDVKKGIKLPAFLTSELAEDIGIHIGDGCMNIYPNLMEMTTFINALGIHLMIENGMITS